MTLDPTPPGIHPTDAMLLLLGDVRSDADAAELMAELRLDAELVAELRLDAELVAELRLDAEPVALTADDPFTPAFVAEAWSHLGACEQCSSRRRALFGELAPAIESPASSASPDAATTLDSLVRAAVAELVPTIAAVPDSLARPAPLRRRWFARRGRAGIGETPGPGGAVARPWIVGIAAAALLLAVGGAFALRPRTTEQSAVGTVPPGVDRAGPGDTTSLETPVFSNTVTAAETDATVAADVMADEQVASTPAIEGARPATAANPRVDRVAPTPVAPEATAERPPRLPVEPSPARAKSKTTAESAEAATDPVPPQPANKKASASSAAASSASASSAAASGLPAGSEPLTAPADLGTFADAASALDLFATRAAPPTDAAATQVGQPPVAGSGNATNTASPAAAPPVEPVLCPTVKGSPRLPARIGDRAVLVVRTAAATVDVVLDAVSCTELARRSTPPTTATVGG